jgi:hypothetical protein
MTVRDLPRAERVQLGAACTVGLSLLLPWYTTGPAASIHGNRGDVDGWVAHPVLRWVVLLGVGAVLLSAWQTITGVRPSHGFERGETSTVVAVAAFGILLFKGLADRPGDPQGLIDLTYGWYLAVLRALVALGAATARLPDIKRGPPGL